MPLASEDRIYERFEEIDWSNWVPEQRATLLFVVRNGRILLIHKKRGIGAGKINGPGGRIDPGETAKECAVREVQEELKITPLDVEERGVLSFQFVDGLSIHCFVFLSTDLEGEPQETDEATPLWIPIDEIPFEKMWKDDSIWLPMLLAGKCFKGRFLFDGDEMLGHEMIEIDRADYDKPGDPEAGLS